MQGWMAQPPWAASGPQHLGRVTSLNLQVQGTGGPAAGPQGPLLPWGRGGQVVSGSERAGVPPRGVAPKGVTWGAWLLFLLPWSHPPALYLPALLAAPASCLPSHRGSGSFPISLSFCALSQSLPSAYLSPAHPVSLHGLVWPNFSTTFLLQ